MSDKINLEEIRKDVNEYFASPEFVSSHKAEQHINDLLSAVEQMRETGNVLKDIASSHAMQTYDRSGVIRKSIQAWEEASLFSDTEEKGSHVEQDSNTERGDDLYDSLRPDDFNNP